jgi:hypothetical protein
MKTPSLRTRPDGALVCDQGWAVRFVTPDLLEYSRGEASCMVNVGAIAEERTRRRIYASESSSDYFPHLHEHLQAVAQHLDGRYEVV